MQEDQQQGRLAALCAVCFTRCNLFLCVAVSQSAFLACRLCLDQVCRAWNKELHTGTAAAAAWHTLSLGRNLYDSVGIVGEEALVAAWAIRHRDFVKEPIIARGFSDDWLMVSMLVQ